MEEIILQRFTTPIKVFKTNIHDAQKSKSKILEDHLSEVWEQFITKKIVSFHQAIRWTLLISNIIPLFPVTGILSSSAKKLSCKPRSFVCILNTLLLLLGFMEMALTVRLAYVLRNFGFSSAAAFTFYFVTVVGGILLRRLANNWPKLMRLWQEKEMIFLKQPYRPPDKNPTIVITILTLIIISILLFEHTFYYVNAYHASYLNIETCNLSSEINVIEHMFRRERAHLFEVIPYNWLFVVIFQMQNFAFAICWSYVDILIIAISIGLTTRFKQFNERIFREQKTIITEEQWLKLRKQYGSLTDLINEVNTHISGLILLSTGNNLYFIVVYVFRIFTIRPELVDKIHYYAILTLLIVRTTIMLFATSRINDASKEIVSVLRRVPDKYWNIEVERFIAQIESQTVALSGKRLFRLTRQLILGFAGTIVTFEIALMDQVEKETSKTNVCEISF